MLCYLTYSLLDWPGIHTCLITCYIVSLSTVAESIEKLALRIAGCLIGAAMGLLVLIFLVPAYDSITALLLTVFLGSFAAAWVATGSPRISYVGFQIAFAFFLCVIQGPSPAFDLAIARDRVVGILFGNLVVYLIFTQVWPVSLKARIESGVANLVWQLTELARAQGRASCRAAAIEVLSVHAAVEEELAVIRYEPAEIRPSARWLTFGEDVLERAAALEAPLFLASERDEAMAQQFADRLSGNAQSQHAKHGKPDALASVVAEKVDDLKRALIKMESSAHATS